MKCPFCDIELDAMDISTCECSHCGEDWDIDFDENYDYLRSITPRD